VFFHGRINRKVPTKRMVAATARSCNLLRSVYERSEKLFQHTNTSEMTLNELAKDLVKVGSDWTVFTIENTIGESITDPYTDLAQELKDRGIEQCGTCGTWENCDDLRGGGYVIDCKYCLDYENEKRFR
jgi:hypothetical protein